MTYIGIDNGVTGSIGFIQDGRGYYHKTPVRKVLNYTKKKAFLNRIDGNALKLMLEWHCCGPQSFCFIERPFTGKFFKAVVSAARAMEATLIVLELLQIPYQFVDSKEWQRVLLPTGLEKHELKRASADVGMRLFPTVDFKNFDDADGLLLADFCRRTVSQRNGESAA